MMNLPEGFSTVTPYIFAENAEKYIEFLIVAFDAREVGRSTSPDGRIANCHVQFSTSIIMVSEASRQFPPSRSAHYVYVSCADAAMAKAEQAGGERIMDVADMPYGDRQGGIRDPWGNIWWISQRLTDKPYFNRVSC